MEKIIFVTGTDTGVGKTLVTASLLYHLRQSGVHALGMKPFCSGGRGDVDLIQAMQEAELPAREVNPFYFPEPVAPLLAARKLRRHIPLTAVTTKIQRVERKCERLIVEGSGGLMVPLGEGYAVADLIAQLRCLVVIVAHNRLGTINHTLLTVRALQRMTRNRLKVLLVDGEYNDVSARTNRGLLGELLAPVEVYRIQFLGLCASRPKAIKENNKKMKKVLAQVLQADIVSPVLLNRERLKTKTC